MNYKELGFRAVYHIFCVFPLTEFLVDAVEDFPGAEQADLVLTYGYVDQEEGVTLEILAVGTENEDDFVFYDTPDDIRSFIRIEAVAEEPFDLLEEEAEELREKYAEKLENLHAYDVTEQVEKSRELDILDDCRHPYYPDDLMVVLMQDGLKPEVCWARVTGLDETWIKGRLLNEPDQDFDWHEGDEITFGLMETENDKMICCAMPGLDAE